MRVLHGIGAGVGVALLGADPQHGHAEGALHALAREARALQHRDADHGDRIAQLAGVGGQGQPVGAHHVHAQVEHAALHPLGDVGLAFPDIDDELVQIHVAFPRCRFMDWMALPAVQKTSCAVSQPMDRALMSVRPTSSPSVSLSTLVSSVPTPLRMGLSTVVTSGLSRVHRAPVQVRLLSRLSRDWISGLLGLIAYRYCGCEVSSLVTLFLTQPFQLSSELSRPAQLW